MDTTILTAITAFALFDAVIDETIDNHNNNDIINCYFCYLLFCFFGGGMEQMNDHSFQWGKII